MGLTPPYHLCIIVMGQSTPCTPFNNTPLAYKKEKEKRAWIE